MTPTCAYCRTAFEAEDEVVACPSCGTTHHADCLAENGGCTIFGCSQAPLEEPKISVTGNELAHPSAATPATSDAPRAAVPPPPRRPGSAPPPPLLIPGMPEVRVAMPPAPLPMSFGGYAPSAPPQQHLPSHYASRKNRVAYVLLAIFFGSLGVHNFYAGYIKKGVIQCCLTVFTCFYGSPLVWIWAIVEACMIHRDADEVEFV